MDAWYVDDSCAAVPPHLFDEALRALDKALAEKGVARGRGADIKSTARITCSPDELEHWAVDANQD